MSLPTTKVLVYILASDPSTQNTNVPSKGTQDYEAQVCSSFSTLRGFFPTGLTPLPDRVWLMRLPGPNRCPLRRCIRLRADSGREDDAPSRHEAATKIGVKRTKAVWIRHDSTHITLHWIT